jgi:hypothetical protein
MRPTGKTASLPLIGTTGCSGSAKIGCMIAILFSKN